MEDKIKYYVKMGGFISGCDEYKINTEGGYGYDDATEINDSRVAEFDNLNDAINHCEIIDEYIVSSSDVTNILYIGKRVLTMEN